jgi:Ca2+-binding RTX toxin-like protein
MNGGDGIDTVENNGFAADEQYTIDAVNGRFRFARLTQIMFALDIGGTEKLVNNTAGGDDSFKTVDPARPVTGLAVTVNGGDRDDALTGTDGADTLNGGTGDDVLTGFKGVDVSNGDEGDDMMVWNNGDASDRNEGGPGDDTAVLNGGAADEHIVITGSGARVTATRDTQVPFFLDIGTSELLDVNTLAGNDSIDVNDNVGKVLATDLAGGDGNDTSGHATTRCSASTAAPARTSRRSTRATS